MKPTNSITFTALALIAFHAKAYSHIAPSPISPIQAIDCIAPISCAAQVAAIQPISSIAELEPISLTEPISLADKQSPKHRRNPYRKIPTQPLYPVQRSRWLSNSKKRRSGDNREPPPWWPDHGFIPKFLRWPGKSKDVPVEETILPLFASHALPEHKEAFSPRIIQMPSDKKASDEYIVTIEELPAKIEIATVAEEPDVLDKSLREKPSIPIYKEAVPSPELPPLPKSPEMPDVPSNVVPMLQEKPDVTSVCSTFTLRHRESEGIGYPIGYSTAEVLLFPFENNKVTWPFFDLRAHRFDDGEYAANAGVGFRRRSDYFEKSLGLNVNYDYRSTHNRSCHYHQLGAGFEILSERWNFNGNVYVPLGGKCLLQKCHWEYEGGYFITRKRFEAPLRGMNFAFEALIKRFGKLGLWGMLEGYYYNGDVCEPPHGGKLGLKVRYGRHLTMEGTISHDNIFHTRVQGQIGISIPFGCKPRDGKWQDILSRPVNRYEIIPLQETCRWNYNY